MTAREPDRLRRRVVFLAAAAPVALLAQPLSAAALAAARPRPLREAYGEREIVAGRLLLELPALAENGNSVPVSVSVDAPMTEDEHVARIDVFAPANPVPRLIRFELTPQCGLASVETRIRLADSQQVWAVAETSAGQLYGAAAAVVVTLAACLDTFG